MGTYSGYLRPDFETRVAIVRRKAELLNLNLSDDVANYIADKLKSNIRQLEGCVKKMKASMHLVGTPPTIAQAQSTVRENSLRRYTFAYHYRQSSFPMLRRSTELPQRISSQTKRTSKISLARKVSAYIIKETTSLSYKSIGLDIGGRDHSTIMYYYEEITNSMNKEPPTSKRPLRIL